jgi:hypothetical protein
MPDTPPNRGGNVMLKKIVAALGAFVVTSVIAMAQGEGSIEDEACGPLSGTLLQLVNSAIAEISFCDSTLGAQLTAMSNNGQIVACSSIAGTAHGTHDGNTIGVSTEVATVAEAAATLAHEAAHIANTTGADGEHDPTTDPLVVGDSTAGDNHSAISESIGIWLCEMSCCFWLPVGCDDIKECFVVALELKAEGGGASPGDIERLTSEEACSGCCCVEGRTPEPPL